MSKETLEQFYQIVLNDQQLKQQFEAASDFQSFTDIAVKLGGENGYSFTPDEVQSLIVEQEGQVVELQDELLEAVAGGKGGKGKVSVGPFSGPNGTPGGSISFPTNSPEPPLE